MNSNLWNLIRREIERYIRTSIADPRIGIVTGVDPVNVRARVKLLPEGTITGWLPIQMPWIGPGWGVVALPALNSQVFVTFQEHDRSSGTITGFHFDTSNPAPQGAASGEFWLVHESGSYMKFLNSGDVQLHAAGNLVITGANQVGIN